MERPAVGLFDSGVGGLSVLRRMLDVARPPWREIVYLADLAHFPYGPRPAVEVRRLALAGVELLGSRGLAAVAVACNTAASSGVRAGSAGLAVPVYDIIGPGAREVAACAAPGPTSRVIVLGTEGTIRSRVWERAIRRAGYPGPIIGWPCPVLANLIEEGPSEAAARRAVLEATRGLEGVRAGLEGVQAGLEGVQAGLEGVQARLERVRSLSGPASVDIVVLGCTHYAFAAWAFEDVLTGEVLGHPVRVVDPAGALANHLAEEVGKCGSGLGGMGGPSDERRVEVSFLTTGRAEHFGNRARQLLADKVAGWACDLRLDRVREVALPEPPV